MVLKTVNSRNNTPETESCGFYVLLLDFLETTSTPRRNQQEYFMQLNDAQILSTNSVYCLQQNTQIFFSCGKLLSQVEYFWRQLLAGIDNLTLKINCTISWLEHPLFDFDESQTRCQKQRKAQYLKQIPRLLVRNMVIQMVLLGVSQCFASEKNKWVEQQQIMSR